MYVKTVTAEGNIMGDPTSSIRDSDTSFLQLFESNLIRRTKRERERAERPQHKSNF